MLAPTIEPVRVRLTLISLPKRDELLLRSVLALPKASISGLASRTLFWMLALLDPPCWLFSATYCKNSLVVSVFPAPDSPDTIQDWLRLLLISDLNASSATP